MYRADRMARTHGRNQRYRLERVRRRIETSLGPLNKLALVELKREHARKLMLVAKKRDGTKPSPSSVRRELDMVRGMVSIAITERDLQGNPHNPFDGLEVAKANAAPDTEWDKRDPLPKDILLAMRGRMKGKLREPALGIIWRLLRSRCRDLARPADHRAGLVQ